MLADDIGCGFAVALKTAAEQTAIAGELLEDVAVGGVDVDVLMGGKDYCGLR